MSDVSIVLRSSLEPGFIFDPEHYHPDRRAAWMRLARGARSTVETHFFSEETLYGSGSNDSLLEVFDLTDAADNLLGDGDVALSIGSTKKIARPGDVVVSRLRSYLREMCVIPNRASGFTPLLSTEFVILRPRHESSGSWLLAFLLSRDAQAVLRWSQTGSNHPRVSPQTIMRMPIPESIIAQRDRLSKLVDEAVEAYEVSRNLYPEAEAELLERLGWNPSEIAQEELYFFESRTDLLKRGRLDAEHFRPKFKRVQQLLRESGCMSLSKAALSIDKGIQPPFYAYDADLLVVKSKDVSSKGIDYTKCERTFAGCYNDQRARLHEGDLLLNATGFGTLGRAAYVTDLPERAIAAVDLLIVRLDSRLVLPEYVSLFLNSEPGLAQSEMMQTGSSGQLHLYPSCASDILIYVPRLHNGSADLAWQKQLATKIVAASRSKRLAQARIMEAKELVDSLIEM